MSKSLWVCPCPSYQVKKVIFHVSHFGKGETGINSIYILLVLYYISYIYLTAAAAAQGYEYQNLHPSCRTLPNNRSDEWSTLAIPQLQNKDFNHYTIVTLCCFYLEDCRRRLQLLVFQMREVQSLEPVFVAIKIL